MPATLRRFGLYDRTQPPDATDAMSVPGAVSPPGRLVGVAIFGVPVQAAVLTNAFPTLTPYRQSMELSRFVLLDAVPANAETWFLSRCLRLLREQGVRGVVSFADPVPRRDSTGRVTLAGHVGTIYQASSAIYTGRSTPRSLVILPDGRTLNARSISKVRAQEQGHEYVQRRLVSLGARPLAAGQEPGVWLVEALADIGAHRVRHRGNHRYLFVIGSRADKAAVLIGGQPRPYPKRPDGA